MTSQASQSVSGKLNTVSISFESVWRLPLARRNGQEDGGGNEDDVVYC